MTTYKETIKKSILGGLIFSLTVFGTVYAANKISYTETVNTGDIITKDWYNSVKNILPIDSADIQDNTVSSSDVLNGTLTYGDTNVNSIQRRVSSICPVGSSIRAIANNGTVTCETDDGGLTSVTSANIVDSTITTNDVLNGTLTYGDTNVNSIQRRVASTCPAGSSIRAIANNGTVTCETDDGGLTSVTSANIINGTIGEVDMAQNQLDDSEIQDNSLTASSIAADSIGASELANNSVGSANVIANSLTAGDLASNSVGNSELIDSPAFTNPTVATPTSGTHVANKTYVDSNAGIPTGAIMSFYLSSCPSLWSVANGSGGTPDLRGSFIRGDLGEENGRDTTRSLGNYQADDYMSHKHGVGNENTGGGNVGYRVADIKFHRNTSYQNFNTGIDSGYSGGTETRPKNITLLYCMKN